MTHTWPTTRIILELLHTDPTAPPAVRSTIGDWLARVEHGHQAVTVARDELRRAKQTEADELRTAPDAVLAMLAAGKYTHDRVAPHLEQYRAAVAVAEDRLRITERAVNRAEALAGRCYAVHAAELVPWVAQHRVAVPVGEAVPDYVARIGAGVAAVVRMVLPGEAWFEVRDGELSAVRPTTQAAVAPNSPRWYWAWCAIAAGLFEVDADPTDGVPVFRVTAPWAHRDRLVAEYGTAAAVTGGGVRRAMNGALGRIGRA